MNLRLNVQYTYEEYAEAQRAHMRADRKQVFRGMLGWIVFIGLAVMFFLVLQSRTPTTSAAETSRPNSDNGPFGHILPLLPWAIIFFVLWGVFFRVLRGQIRKVWNGSVHLQQPRVLTISDEMFADATTLASHAYRWAAFVQYRETPNLFVLYPTKYNMQIVPKRAFPSPADVDAFRAFLQRVINPAQAFPVLLAR